CPGAGAGAGQGPGRTHHRADRDRTLPGGGLRARAGRRHPRCLREVRPRGGRAPRRARQRAGGQLGGGLRGRIAQCRRSARGHHPDRARAWLRPGGDGLAWAAWHQGAGARQRHRQGAHPFRPAGAGVPATRQLTCSGTSSVPSLSGPLGGRRARFLLSRAIRRALFFPMIRSLYLAGPDVFRPDATRRGQELKALCARHGFEGLFPLDQDVPADITDPAGQAAWIYRNNIALIERADAVLANLDFFRGPEPDSGTCFEVDYAVAKGKPVYGYIPEQGSLAQRIRLRHPQAIGGDGLLDVHGWNIEEFGLPLNLMLSVPAPLVVGDAGVALAHVARLLRAG